MNQVEVVQQAEETEQQLVERARTAESDAAWIVGECASLWTQRYSRGRTDAAFAEMVGLNSETVAQRRRVFDLFSGVRKSYTCMTFSHFRIAAAWPDAPECLAWADENGASVREMQAWRRMQRGEDLTIGGELKRTETNSDEEPEHVADADPYQWPPTTVVNTPKAEPAPVFNPKPIKPPEPVNQTSHIGHETPDPFARIIESLDRISQSIGDLKKRDAAKLAAKLRALADQLDPEVEPTPGEDHARIQRRRSFLQSDSPTSTRPTAYQPRTLPAVIIEEWNAAGLTPCLRITDKRKSQLKSRWSDEFFREHWREAIAKAKASAFCRGENDRGWVANLEWFLRPDTVVSLCEGKYSGQAGTKNLMGSLDRFLERGGEE